MGDETRRRLQIPPSYVPYLEKYRIYELFHEIARELVIQQPTDHVMFIKQILVNAAQSRDIARVVLIASPRVNTVEIATLISKITNQLVLTEKNLLTLVNKNSRAEVSNSLLVKGLGIMTRTQNGYKLGWIIADIIRNEEDAKAILQAGILPTHVLHIIPPFYPDFKQILYCHVPTEFPEYRRTFLGIKKAFEKTIHEIYIGSRGINEVVDECVDIIKIRKGVAPLKPRVLIIGPRGSGRKTQAKMLQKDLGLIHIDFEYLICQMWLADHDLGVRMRECKDEVCLHPELMVQILNKRLLENDCLTRGYVLTHYPYTEYDFKLLDSLDTPPNRVIFLEIEVNICRERLRSRKVDVYTGSVSDLGKDEDLEEDDDFARHPKDNMDIINAEIDYFCEQYGGLRKYAGNTANFVNADQNEYRVYECIAAIITRASPTGPPRTGLTTQTTTTSVISVGSGENQSDEIRCTCIPVPKNVNDCYRDVFSPRMVDFVPQSSKLM